jgi:hypothetical protein
MDIGHAQNQGHHNHPRKFFKLIAEIDEFKGRWTAIETLAPEKLTSLPADRHH